jgi:hypothetical protein
MVCPWTDVEWNSVYLQCPGACLQLHTGRRKGFVHSSVANPVPFTMTYSCCSLYQ